MLRILTIALSLVLFTACKKDADKPADPAAKTNEKADEPKKDEPKKDEPSMAKEAPKTDKTEPPKGEPAKVEEPKKDNTAASTGEMTPELEAKGVALMKGLGETFASNADNCDKLAAAIKKFAEDNKDTFQQIKDVESKQTKEQKKAFDEKHKDLEKDLEAKVMPAMKNCQKSAAVMDAMKSLPLE